MFYSFCFNKVPSRTFGKTWVKVNAIFPYKQRLDELFITKQEQKARNKNKIGLPPNKRYRLTPLARHDDFNDAHIKDKNQNIKRAS